MVMRSGFRQGTKAALVVALILSLGFATRALAEDDMNRKLAAGDIIVSSHAVPGSDVQEAKMTAIIKAPPQVVWQIVTDINHFKDFMPQTRNSMVIAADKIPELLRKTPASAEEVEKILGPTPAAVPHQPGKKYTVYHYSDLHLPWPCNNRWYVLKGTMDETRSAQHIYRSSWKLLFGNIKKDSGEWLLQPYGTRETKLTYRLSTDPGGSIPSFLVKRATGVTLPQVMKAIRKRAAEIYHPKTAA
jgi:ribosome-associated toxin RatA of RatAB toxin-antitoxin module